MYCVFKQNAVQLPSAASVRSVSPLAVCALLLFTLAIAI
jgi:hypothetical protein